MALFLFFFQVLPYHLFHKEQTQLFIYTAETLREYLNHPAALANLLGDFLTQFFYYEGAGPVIMALVLLLWGVVVYKLLSPYMGGWACLPAAIAVVWETGRACGWTYPLSGTIALTGIVGTLLFCRSCLRRSWKTGVPLSIVALAAGYWLFGTGEWKTLYDRPDLEREHLLAVDTEMYFGRRKKVEKLMEKEKTHSHFTTYYYNLLHAQQQQLPEELMVADQPASRGLFLPVAPGHTYLSIFAANEVWFSLGDMTMAEHAAILGMIFSPRHTGARAMKRLAEINLLNGDEEAAMKYLRLLQKTLCYHDWAMHRMPGKQTAEVQQWLERKRQMLPATDTLRSSASTRFSLRFLLQEHPDDQMACDYLLCHDLLDKNIYAFVEDYQAFVGTQSVSHRLYAEGLLIYLAGKQASKEEVMNWNIPTQVLAEFDEYTRMYKASKGDRAPLLEKFGNTYWYYFHFASQKK